jgi:rhodanese-related sulfurtransferase
MSELPLEISCLEVKTKLDGGDDQMLLLDCRETNEHALVSIAAAVLVPMSELAVRVGELDEHRERHVVVHCHLGGRSAQVAAWLRQQGFPRAQSMAGGIDQWAVEIEPRMARY